MSKTSVNPVELSGAEVTNFIVKVKDRDAIDHIVAELGSIGFHVERVMKRVGVVGGHGPAELVDEIATVPGIQFVREEGSFQLPPMDESIPQ